MLCHSASTLHNSHESLGVYTTGKAQGFHVVRRPVQRAIYHGQIQQARFTFNEPAQLYHTTVSRHGVYDSMTRQMSARRCFMFFSVSCHATVTPIVLSG